MLMKFKQLGIVKGILSIVAVIGALVCIGYGVHYQFVYKQSPELYYINQFKMVIRIHFLQWLMVKESCIGCLIRILKNY